MHVMRKHQPVIVGLLQAIVTDPFWDWAAPNAKPARGAPRGKAPRASNRRALQALAGVQGRLQGVLAGAQQLRCRPMTVDAHVDFLLAEAQALENLARMFIGWLPYW